MLLMTQNSYKNPSATNSPRVTITMSNMAYFLCPGLLPSIPIFHTLHYRHSVSLGSIPCWVNGSFQPKFLTWPQ